MQVRLMVEPFSMYLSLGPSISVLGWMTPRYILCSRWGVVLTWTWWNYLCLFAGKSWPGNCTSPHQWSPQAAAPASTHQSPVCAEPGTISSSFSDAWILSIIPVFSNDGRTKESSICYILAQNPLLKLTTNNINVSETRLEYQGSYKRMLKTKFSFKSKQ